MIEIITAHEADQIIRLRRPLGTDYQGRYPEAAHPATDIGAEDPPRQPMTPADRVWLLLAGTGSVTVSLAVVAVLFFAAMGALPYVLALGRWIAGALS